MRTFTWTFANGIIPHKISKYKKHFWLSAIVVVIIAICIRPIWAGFACVNNPCVHGICIDDIQINRTHQCYCRNGFTGYSCQINWDECRTSPCLNGGTCIDGIASFNCSCPENFSGNLCEYDLSVCDEQFVCQNNGSCTYDPNSANGTGFMCSCLPGFKGSQCEIDISICNTTDNVCHNGGKCIDGLGSAFICECEPGWSGQTCQTDINECESQPCQNGGICIDKINDFNCACPFGYMGKACETKLKICEENPCLNGAFCLEEDDKKTCYCVPDYHGVLCEEKYDECYPPPKCYNGGTCVDGVGGFACSCPPDFFGPKCQCTIANATEPECQGYNSTITPPLVTESLSVFPNPTLPISTLSPERTTEIVSSSPDGTLVLSSTSTVAAHLSSEMYDWSLSLESPYDPGGNKTATPTIVINPSITLTSPEESPESPTPTFHSTSAIMPSLSLTPYFSDSDIGIVSESLYLTTQSVTIEESSLSKLPFPSPSLSTSLFSIVGEESSVLMSLSTLIYNSDAATASEDIASYSPVSTTTSVPGGMDGTASLSPSFPVESSSSDLFRTSPIAFPSESISVELSPSISDDVGMESSKDYIKPTATPTILIPTADLTAIPRTTIDVIESPLPTNTNVGDDSSEVVISNESSPTIAETIPFSSPTPTTLIVATVPPYHPDASSDFVGTVGINVSLSLAPTVTTASDSLLTSVIVVPPGQSQDIIDSDRSSVQPRTEFPYETSNLLTISEIIASPTAIRSRGSSDVFVTTTKVIPSDLFSMTITPTTTFSVSSPEPTLIVSSPTPTPAANLSDPCDNYCQNNAKCISESIEPICLCPFKFMGERCEIARKRFETPSFSGNSFLAYKLPAGTVNIVNITTQMATVVPEGILIYTGSSSVYSLIFLSSGLVTLHFSCGFQSMHFVETRTRVDNGYNFTLEFEMNMVIHGANEFRCIGEVSVNHSYIMKGEQIVGRNSLHGNPIDIVYIGGVHTNEAQKNDELIAVLPGFRGCMHKLMINQESQNMFGDALDGGDISECSAFGCIVNPCSPSSRCVSTNKFPFWECICSPGYQGIRCQIRVCSYNPCLNGATCTVPLNNKLSNVSTSEGSTSASSTASSLSTTAICLCPLGYTGLMCQSQVNITKPSFRPIFHYDYSAFIAYDPIPRFADWVQLKFHFVTTNMTQISILMYTGNDWVNAPITPAQLESPLTLSHSSQLKNSNYFDQDKAADFFAITFLQGFIALTWNLGSGTQRIITPSRIDNRLNVHTLFAGRSGRHAWLKVDGMRNSTGKAPGPLYRLNVDTDLYVGGYEAFRFEGLPHDLPLHKGFQGCIFDLGFRVKNKLYLPVPIRGRNVKNCYEEDC